MPGHHQNPKSSKHWFRLVVPKDLRAKVGQTEIKHSLGTSNDLEADALRAKHRQEWTARFAELRQEKAQEDLAQAPIVVDEFLRMLADRRDGDIDSVMYGLQKLLTVKLLTAWGPHEFEARGADRAIAFMPDIDAWEGQPDPCGDIIPEDERDRLIARIRLLHHHPGTFGAGFREPIRHVSDGRRWGAVRSDVMMIEEFTGRTIDHGTAFYDAVAEAYVQRLLEHFSYRWDPALLDDLDPPAGFQDAHSAPQGPHVQAEEKTIPPPDTNLGRSSESMSPLSAGYQQWIKVAAPGASAVREAGRAVERFIELFGDKSVAMITDDDLFNHRDFVEAMPANLSLPAIKASGLSLREAVEKAWLEKPDRAKLSPTSVKKEMSAFSAIFGVLKSERWIRSNSAADIPVSGYSKARSKQKNPRLPLRPNMMTALFSSPLFTGCVGPKDIKRTLPGTLVFQDELYWTFLFGATTGPRVEEVGQVALDDIEVVQEPEKPIVVGIYVTGTGLDQSIKNDASARVILVHPKLIELGFLDYVEQRRAAGATKLFDLKKSTLGTWSKELSRRLNRYIDRTVIDDGRFVFHSMRHEFSDRSEINISEAVSKKMMGHARGRLYGLGAPLHHLAAEMNKLDLSFIDWDRLKKAAGRS